MGFGAKRRRALCTRSAGAPSIARVTFDPAAPHAVDAEDVEYARPSGTPLLARIYRPRGASGPLAALVDVHGGAWSFFDRTVDFYFNTALAACGLVVAAIDFRQGAHGNSAAVDDILTAIRFLRSNAARLDVDPARVA